MTMNTPNRPIDSGGSVNRRGEGDDDGNYPAIDVLLVDDEASIRVLAGHILRRNGFTVLEASNGMEALRILKSTPSVQLLISDVEMPEMRGTELAEEATEIRPDLKILLLSGYTDDSRVHRGVLRDEFGFLAKPFSPAELMRRVRQILG
jgi:two-component system, cell cycle sensor histidine kinase and response regulator CckA